MRLYTVDDSMIVIRRLTHGQWYNEMCSTRKTGVSIMSTSGDNRTRPKKIKENKMHKSWYNSSHV